MEGCCFLGGFFTLFSLWLCCLQVCEEGFLPVAAIAPDLELVDHVVASKESSFRQWSRGGLWLHGYKDSK